ncbi:MAG: hypothetical protein JRI72_15180 [Deltaproteobacteria bacterium]|nr:hypothetical protein [Deltaproteobacteria bacterium]
MKKHHFYGGLFVVLLLITKSCSYLTNNIKNTNNYSPPLEQAKHVQAQLLAIQTTPDKKSSPLLRPPKKYKRKISGLLGLLRFWNNHRLARKITRLEVWIQIT